MHATISKPALFRRDILSVVGTAFQPFLRVILLELQHRLRQLDNLDLLPLGIRRFLIDDHVPGASLTLVPELSANDFVRLLERPTKQRVNEWIQRGERSVWPAVSALKVRCAIEVELDRGYQLVRRRKPMDATFVASNEGAEAVADDARKSEDSPLTMQANGRRLRGPGEKRRKRSRGDSSGRISLDPLQTVLPKT